MKGERFVLDGIETWFYSIKNDPLPYIGQFGALHVSDTLRCSICGWETKEDYGYDSIRFHVTMCEPNLTKDLAKQI